MTQMIAIDGKDYAVDQLPQSARVQINNIAIADAEIARVQQQLALVQTARNAYAGALRAAMETVAQPPAAPAAAKKTVARKPVARKSAKSTRSPS